MDETGEVEEGGWGSDEEGETDESGTEGDGKELVGRGLHSLGTSVLASPGMLWGLAEQATVLCSVPSLAWVARRVSTMYRASTSTCLLSARFSVTDL